MAAMQYESKLVPKVRNMIANRGENVTLNEIAEISGVTKSWLTAFVCGQIPDPSVSRIEALYDALSSVPLISE